jgi:alkylation response protein AidB-like acyl-CoA dehydrogenase
VDFDLSVDQLALRDGIRGLVEGKLAMPRVRAGFDRSVHDDLAAAGVLSLLADGFGHADAAVVLEELGRALVPGPIVWGLLAQAYADGMADRVVGGVERPARDEPALVEHFDALDALVVVDAEGVSRVDPGAVESTAIAWPLDPLTPVHAVERLRDGERIGGREEAAQWRLVGAVLTAAYSVGMAQACTERALAYAKERQQFDRPIGSFQAVKHILADMAVRAEVARAAVHAAAVHLDDPATGAVSRAASGAKLLAGEAAIANGRAATQVHGGMGFTWEVDIHLYLKRAWVLDTVFGSADAHADAVAATLAR